MMILGSTSDLIQVITGSAVVNTAVHASWVDNAAGTITPGRTNTIISTAATTTVVGSPGASTYRNLKFLSVRNTHASSQNTITIQHTDGTNVIVLWNGVLNAGMSVQVDENGKITVRTAGGIEIATTLSGAYYNASVAAQGPGFASDTYVVGSNILIPAQLPRVGTIYRCRISVSKTAAGTATPILQVRHGVNASTADESHLSFTFSAGTAATDTGMFEVIAAYRTVGGGTSAVLQGHCRLVSQPTTGFSSLLKGVQTTSAGHDSTVAGNYIGVSMNGGTSAAWTVQQVTAELMNI